MLSSLGLLRSRRVVSIRLGFFGGTIPNASKVISVISYSVALRPSMVTTFSERYMPYTISIKSVLVPFHTNCGFSFFLGSAFLKTTAIFLILFIVFFLCYFYFHYFILDIESFITSICKIHYRYSSTIHPSGQQTRLGLKGYFQQRGWQSQKPYQPVWLGEFSRKAPILRNAAQQQEPGLR